MYEDRMPERELASHQKRALEHLSSWWKSRSRHQANGFLVMPTGSGKTFTAVTFAVEQILAKRRGPCVVWVAHNEFLLAQAEKEFRRQLESKPLPEPIALGRARGDGTGTDANVIFAMIQTLAVGEAVAKIKREGAIDLVIFDEFHRLAADTWQRVPRRFQRSKIRTLGLSATPFRKSADKTDLLRDILPHRVYSVGYTELVRDRFLAEPRLMRIEVNGRPIELDDRERAHLRRFRQLNQSALDRIAHQVGRDQLVIDTYRKNTDRFRSTIVFCCSVDHAEHLASEFRRCGIGAESICGSSKSPVNVEKLERFKKGEFPIATSVVLLTEGVDVPACRTVFLARPCESPVLISQMIGRAMRGPKSGGGDLCNIVDFVDILGDGMDLAASHFGFVRDNDERIRHLVRRPPRPGGRGVSLSLLLRIREFLNELLVERGGASGLGHILHEEIAGWLEYWDGQLHRVLLVPHDRRARILDAVEAVRDAAADLEPGEQLGTAAELARAVYDEEALDDSSVSEEDFVALAAAAVTDRDGVEFHELMGETGVLADAAVVQEMTTAVDELEADVLGVVSRSDFADAFEALRRLLRRD